MTKLDDLALHMITYYAADPARIQHFIKVHSFAALIARQEGMDAATLEILEAAAYVHDIGIKPAEQTYGSSAGRYQEELGPAPARAMMLECGFTPAQADRVAYLVGHHHSPEQINEYRRGAFPVGRHPRRHFLVYVASVLFYEPIFTQPLSFGLCAAGTVEKFATDGAVSVVYLRDTIMHS